MAFECEIIHSWHSIDYTPAGAVAAGEVIVVDKMVGVARQAIAAGELGSLCVAGVGKFAKATGGGTAFTAGELIYWDESAGVCDDTTDTGTNPLIGWAIKAAADGDATAEVMWFGGAHFATA
ncbi:MAG: DUF2190 family protein [Acidobacteria bacterium]|nr:DUF2190 family protein [Acidobacteriota bacterium]